MNSQHEGLNLKRDLQAEAELLIRSRYGCEHEDAPFRKTKELKSQMTLDRISFVS